MTAVSDSVTVAIGIVLTLLKGVVFVPVAVVFTIVVAAVVVVDVGTVATVVVDDDDDGGVVRDIHPVGCIDIDGANCRCVA